MSMIVPEAWALLRSSSALVDSSVDINQGPPIPWSSILFTVLWFTPALLFWWLDFLTTRRRRTVEEGTAVPSEGTRQSPLLRVATAESTFSQEQDAETTPKNFAALQARGRFPVMLASLEHSLPHLPKARAVAGGLGKVVDLIGRHHPSDILIVHPMLKQQEGKLEYGEAYDEQPPLRLVLDGVREDVRVFRFVSSETMSGTADAVASETGEDSKPSQRIRVEFLMLSHDLFKARSCDCIYPNPMSRRNVLAFFSLWNQAVGALLARHKPAVFHCPDFHTALAPWYAVPEWPHLRVLLVLHNSEYQGTISTDMIYGKRLKAIASLFNLPVSMVKDHLILDGRFNMLKAAVDYCREKQGGVGVCAVSQWYAAECHSVYALLWGLPRITGLDNPMLEEERAVLPAGLSAAKEAAKLRIQRRFGLEENPNARIFVSLGRLVRQKGVDLVADVAPWLLSHFPDAQLVLVGPVGDGFGHYAASKLQTLFEDRQFNGRLYVNTEFMRDKEALKDMKLGADFCLMPSRDEPFGYVDIEFAWHGALLVGAQAGGLGKVPGFYYLAQNRENLERLRLELRTAVSQAMCAPIEKIQRMADAALRCEFPLDRWQNRLLGLYESTLVDVPTLEEVTPPSTEGPGRFEPHSSGTSIELNQTEARPRAGTFCPYQATVLLQPSRDAGRQRLGSEGRLTTPVSAVDVAVRHQSTSFLDDASVVREEFLTQELDEEELADRVRVKVTEHTLMGIDEVLESVGCDVDIEREDSRVGRWLLGKTFGTQRIHILLALGYVASPVGEFFTFVTATEWGLRGAESAPLWARRWIGESIDPPVLQMALFAVNALAYAVSAPIWALLCRYFQPRRLLAASLLLQLPLLLMLRPVTPRIGTALLAVACHGLVTSASMLFLVFNFMMSIKADVSNYATRMGALEMMRYVVTWMLTGYVFLASPSSLNGTAQQPLPNSVLLLMLPIALLMVLMTLVPGVLLLFAPGPYRNDRFPGWDLQLFFKKRSFVLLFISECIGSLALFPGTCYISWWLTNGWSSSQLASLSIAFAVMLALGTLLWATALSLASVHGFSFLVGVAVMLRASVQDEVATITSLGRSDAALIIGVISLFLEGVRSSAIWTAKIRILNSRWRLLSYGSLLQFASHFCAFLSPILCEWIARRHATTFSTRNQKELADAVIVSAVPLGILQFIFQVASCPFIYKDMGISIGAERSTRSLLRKLKRSTSLFAFGTAMIVGVVLWYRMEAFLGFHMPMARIARCVTPVAAQCDVIVDEVDPREATDGWHYGPNRFGQNTTGLKNCHFRMNAVGGDTFVFWGYGRCQVQSCGNASNLMLENASQEDLLVTDVWSKFCDASRPDMVAVHLFEWPWRDIGLECEQYLAPAGFTVVQVSPPQEHILGDSWAVRYQPVSYQLESRGGSYEEFVDMVARCRASGIAVMVDVVLNHMAGPYVYSPDEDRGKECGHQHNSSKTSTQKCLGWAGTEYGNREFPNGRPDLDRFDRDMFHHYPDNNRANCGLPPWTNNFRLCDMYGLPDINTELSSVQHQLTAFLFELFEIGVTMLRIDAAMAIFPESLASVVLPLPWEYLVQEYYPDQMRKKEEADKATTIGSATDFTFGSRVAQSLFDSGWSGNWKERPVQFGELLELQKDGFAGCVYGICNSPYETNHALLFLDNHDQQRERWKPGPGQLPETGVCPWDGLQIGSCRPIYKHGRTYNLAQLYMLAWPYGGEARPPVRLLSSYGFQNFNEGPPGVRNNSLRDFPLSPVLCRDSPTSSPVTDEYDKDQSRPWNCEHRWKGVSGLVRFRHLTNRSEKVHLTWNDQAGHIGFSLGTVGFVALSRGYNWYTGQGSNLTYQLQGTQVGMPAGSYCNLADEMGAVPSPGQWLGRCNGSSVLVRDDGKIDRGELSGGDVVAIHVLYPEAPKKAEIAWE